MAAKPLRHGLVVGNIFQVIGDSRDADKLPDLKSPPGTISFTPVDTRQVAEVSSKTTLLLKERISCTINTVGQLQSPANEPGVWLVVGQYLVTFATGSLGDPSPFLIEVTAAYTEAAPLDLPSSIPAAAQPAPIPNWQVLTLAQYTALPLVNPEVLYLIRRES